MDILYDTIDSEVLITSKIQDRKGHTIVSYKYCRMNSDPRITNEGIFYADNETSIKIRKAVQKMLDKNIYLEELGFRPGRGKGKEMVLEPN